MTGKFQAPARAIGMTSAPPPRAFKYPSEDECLVRRFGSAVLAVWGALPPDAQAAVLAEAAIVWDREYGVPKLAQKLEAFIKRHPGRMA